MPSWHWKRGIQFFTFADVFKPIFEAPLFHKGASYISKYLHSPRNFNNIPRKLIHILRIWHQYSPKFVSHILHFQVKWLRNIKTIELYPEFIDIPRKQVIPSNS